MSAWRFVMEQFVTGNLPIYSITNDKQTAKFIKNEPLTAVLGYEIVNQAAGDAEGGRNLG